jgi:hypothetical protein
MSVGPSSFYPHILPEVPQCPRVMVRDVLNAMAAQFCERTFIWREIQDPYAIAAGVRDYTFDAPAGAAVFKVMAAELDGHSLSVQAPEYLDETAPGWRDAQATYASGVQALTQLEPTVFLLVPNPSQNATLVLDVAYKPTRAASTYPNVLYDDYQLAICAGVKAYLQGMKGQPWSDPQQAVKNAALFDDAVISARRRQSKAFGRARIRVKAQFL